jgi:hypothetical protein
VKSHGSKIGEHEASSPESKAIVEDLTGWKYEQLWGKALKLGETPTTQETTDKPA